jgi:hypothetical protein
MRLGCGSAHTTRPLLSQKCDLQPVFFQTEGCSVGRPNRSTDKNQCGSATRNSSSSITSPHPQGHVNPTRNDYRYLRRLSGPEASPGHPLAACLPDYRSRGNRVPRLTPDQVRIAKDVIQSHWILGRCKDQSQLLGHVDAACSEESIPKISKSALRNMCLKIAPEQVAYGRFGIRGYHAARPPVLAEHATVRCEIPGLISHIDSTQFDVRSWSIFKLSMFCEPPWFYVFYDEATDKALGRGLVLGSPTDLLYRLHFGTWEHGESAYLRISLKIGVASTGQFSGNSCCPGSTRRSTREPQARPALAA